MAFCSKCGAHIPDDAKFCNNCGQVQPNQKPDFSHIADTKDYTSEINQDDIAKNKAISIFSYIGLLFLVPMLGAKESRFAQFHAKQGLILFIAEVCCWIVCAILSALAVAFWMLWPVTVLLRLVSWLVSLLPVPFIIIGIVNVAQGQAKELPIIGRFTK